MKTAAQLGLARCHICGALERIDRGRCHRCNAQIHLRKPDSISRSWALLISAVVLYIPANTLPIMTVSSLGQEIPATILEGVLRLIDDGMWPIATVIFIASIFIPVMKLTALAGLLISVQLNSVQRLKERSRLYGLVDWVGRWSMVDVYVVAVLAALVQLGDLVQITGNAGVTMFAAVVILSVLAAESFDPRLIWDNVDREDNE